MTQKPNILFITSDQHRADFLGHAGQPWLRTPHLDALAYQGTRFDRAYVDCPVCIPARTTMITGIPAHVNGQPEYAESWRVERDRLKFLGSLVTAAGYQTELIGKTHWHTPEDFRAGFEHVTRLSGLRKKQYLLAGRSQGIHGLGWNEVDPSLSTYPPELYSSDWIADLCMDFLIQRDTGQPFMLWASFIDPHPPLTIHEPFYSMYRGAGVPDPVLGSAVGTDAELFAHYEQRLTSNPLPIPAETMRRAREVYSGMITNLDYQIGRIVGHLSALGILDDTLIIYTSDHGEHLGDQGLIGKRTFYDCSARVPLIIRPPHSWDAPSGQATDALVENADLLPTICSAAGAEIPEDVTGCDLAPLVRNETRSVRTAVHGRIGNSHAWITDQHKLMADINDGGTLLFDLADDPTETEPVDDPDLEAALRESLVKHLEAEGSDHVEDHELVNLQKTRHSPEELAAANLNVQGLGAGAKLADLEKDILNFH